MLGTSYRAVYLFWHHLFMQVLKKISHGNIREEQARR